MKLKSLIRRVLPIVFKPPHNLPNHLLAATGYYRFRTWLAAHGNPVPDSHLYRPLFVPWDGEVKFQQLYEQIRPHTLLSPDRCYILWKTLAQASRLQGDFIECGVYRGGTALLAAKTLESESNNRTLHLFDSFEGMPETMAGVDQFEATDFNKTSVESVRQLFSSYPFVKIHQGFIPQSFVDLDIPQVAWAHIDVDIYQSVKDCIAYLYPRMAPAGIMVFDDYGFPSCAGARRAVDEAFAELPETPLYLPTGQCLVIKLPF